MLKSLALKARVRKKIKIYLNWEAWEIWDRRSRARRNGFRWAGPWRREGVRPATGSRVATTTKDQTFDHWAAKIRQAGDCAIVDVNDPKSTSPTKRVAAISFDRQPKRATEITRQLNLISRPWNTLKYSSYRVLSFVRQLARDVNREPTDLNLDLISYRGCADTRRERERGELVLLNGGGGGRQRRVDYGRPRPSDLLSGATLSTSSPSAKKPYTFLRQRNVTTR